MAGWTTVDVAITQPDLRRFIEALMREEIEPTLPDLPDLPDLPGLAVAAWLHFLRGVDELGQPYPIDDPQAEALTALHRATIGQRLDREAWPGRCGSGLS